MKNTLCIYTSRYPYGNSETFIENEIEHLSKAFDKVYIFPFTKSDTVREIPNNVEVVDLFENHKYSRNEVVKKDLGLFSKIITQELLVGNLFNQEYKNTISRLLQLFSKSYELEKWLTNNSMDNTSNYSYWFEDWATILSILKTKKIINSFISRAHGFDLYEERSKIMTITFRELQLQQLDKLFLISKHGKDYITKKHIKYSEKFEVSYLGTNDNGSSKFNPVEDINILTVSNVALVKRINLLIDALQKVNTKINWTHFGDGILYEEILDKANELPSNITVNFKGRLSNVDMLLNIKNNHFDLFVNVSESEGLPVSIMEAVSFGIPVFATDAGGTREIVNNKTGKLYPNNIDVKELALDIEKFKSSKYSTEDFRMGVREFWKDNFDASKNYKKFINKLY